MAAKPSPWTPLPIAVSDRSGERIGLTSDAPPGATRCLNCGRVNDAVTGVDQRHKPRPGDAAVCFECRHVMMYVDGAHGLEFRHATPEESDAVIEQLWPGAPRPRRSPW
jgi:hypothetical protein